MKQMICIFLVLILGSVAFAGITPSEPLNLAIKGGEDYNHIFYVKNEFNSNAFVNLSLLLDNNSKDFNGFEATFSDNNFILNAVETKKIILIIKTVPNIRPETYDINIQATYTIDVPQDPSQGYRYNAGRGGTRYIDKNIDKNIYIDNNVIINVPYEVVKIVDNNIIVQVDKNIEVEKIIQVESINWLNMGVMLLIGIIVGGLIIFIVTRGSNSSN